MNFNRTSDGGKVARFGEPRRNMAAQPAFVHAQHVCLTLPTDSFLARSSGTVSYAVNFS
jgi:hypothetical protein